MDLSPPRGNYSWSGNREGLIVESWGAENLRAFVFTLSLNGVPNSRCPFEANDWGGKLSTLPQSSQPYLNPLIFVAPQCCLAHATG